MQQLTDIPAIEFIPGFFGRFIHGAQTTVSFVDIKKGSRLPQHHHPQEQVSYIVEGELEMQIGDETLVLKTGSVNVIPSNVPHTAFALTDCKVIDTFSPARDDYRY